MQATTALARCSDPCDANGRFQRPLLVRFLTLKRRAQTSGLLGSRDWPRVAFAGSVRLEDSYRRYKVPGMHTVEIVLVLIALCVGLALLARHLAVPYSAVLVVGGMALALVPDAPRVPLPPDLALAFFLPPLLQASAYRTDWRGFRANLRPILLLAVGCVLFTAAGVAWVATLLVPEMPWAAALALGAILAPPDAVAAASVLQRLRLPRRIVTVLEGESLINDASALVLYRIAVAAVAAGMVSPWLAALQFLAVGIGGGVIGFLLGRLAVWLVARLDDPLLETALSFLVCYASFLGAEQAGVSGVIAVVTTGLVLGQAQHRAFSPRTRVFARAVWEFLEFILNSLVFILIGLQLNHILDRLESRGIAELAGLTAAVAATLIVTRFVWVFPAAYVPRWIPRIRRADPAPPWTYVTIIGWAGMRGVVSLAAALALPEDFPERDLIVFLAFTAILVTLVLQGTTLEWVIRRLGVTLPAPHGGVDQEEAVARQVAARAAQAEIEHWLDDPLEGAIAADIVQEYRDRAGHLHRIATGHAAAAAERAARRRLRLAALDAARRGLLEHHAAVGLHDEALAKLAQELDFEELRVRQVLGDERSDAERLAEEGARRREATPLLALPTRG
jgi:CPA1 family monovalent cation:H+ antiporter